MNCRLIRVKNSVTRQHCGTCQFSLPRSKWFGSHMNRCRIARAFKWYKFYFGIDKFSICCTQNTEKPVWFQIEFFCIADILSIVKRDCKRHLPVGIRRENNSASFETSRTTTQLTVPEKIKKYWNYPKIHDFWHVFWPMSLHRKKNLQNKR